MYSIISNKTLNMLKLNIKHAVEFVKSFAQNAYLCIYLIYFFCRIPISSIILRLLQLTDSSSLSLLQLLMQFVFIALFFYSSIYNIIVTFQMHQPVRKNIVKCNYVEKFLLWPCKSIIRTI